MPAPKISGFLRGKPTFPIQYETAVANHSRQVADIIDRLTLSKSQAIPGAIANPQKIKWELILDKGYDPHGSGLTYEEILQKLCATTKVFLRGTVCVHGGHGGGAVVRASELKRIPDTIMPLLEQRAKMLAGQQVQDESDEDDLGNGSYEVAGTMGGIVEMTPVAFLDSWFEQHKKANRRLYYVARELMKHLMESEKEGR
jgi:hypothetical protein